MNIHDEMSDDQVLRAAADTLSTSPVPPPPDATAIMARGRARRRRRLAGIGVAGTAATAGAALGLTSVLAGGPAPALATGTARTPTGTARTASETIRTTAFTLVKNADGTVTLTLTKSQMLNPVDLQQALAKDGIPALVKIGAFCSSHPAVEAHGAIAVQLPDGTPVPGPSPARNGQPARRAVPLNAVWVFHPAAIPAGTELSFGYFNYEHLLAFGLIRTDSYTCATDFNGLPPGA
jgi:hypothetical protein